MTAGSEALDAAKKLYGSIVKLAERRERRVQKATGDFQIDLLETIRTVPTPILDIVERAVRNDPGQAYLQLALAVAVDERRREHATAETEAPPPPTLNATGNVLLPAPGVERLPPPPRIVGEDDAGELEGIESPMESDDAPSRPRVETYTNGELLVPEYRYPEPGEPATMLPDGSVVAIEDAPPPLDLSGYERTGALV